MPTLEFLCIKNNADPLPSQEPDQAYRRGDVVAIEAAPFMFGQLENPDLAAVRFVILTLDGANVPTKEDLMYRGFLGGVTDFDGIERVRREKTLRLQDLPTPKLNELNRTGRVTINLAIFNDIVTIRRGPQ